MVQEFFIQLSLTKAVRFLVGLLTISIFFGCKNVKQMSNSQQIHAFRLKPGEDLKKSIIKYVDENKITAGYVITCVGSLTEYHLRFANKSDGSRGSGHFEIVSLTGVLSTEGSHIHISISDITGKTIGGHLMDGCKVYTTAEIIIGEDKTKVFTREVDSTFGYKELRVKKAE
jgi:uncharacterized protein